MFHSFASLYLINLCHFIATTNDGKDSGHFSREFLPRRYGRSTGSRLLAPSSNLTSLAHSKNRSAVALRFSLRQAAPIMSGGGGGEMGMSFKRGPAVQPNNSEVIATPAPASTAAIKLAALSCSSAIRIFAPAKMASSSSW